jgi:hypothetical protein
MGALSILVGALTLLGSRGAARAQPVNYAEALHCPRQSHSTNKIAINWNAGLSCIASFVAELDNGANDGS